MKKLGIDGMYFNKSKAIYWKPVFNLRLMDKSLYNTTKITKKKNVSTASFTRDKRGKQKRDTHRK